MARISWRWHKVKVPPLLPAACRKLVELLTDQWPVGPKQLSHFRRQLLKLAEGNPCTLVEICRRAASQLDDRARRIDPQYLWWDWQAERCRDA